MDNNNYKRQYRQLNDTTKQKISQSLREAEQNQPLTPKLYLMD